MTERIKHILWFLLTVFVVTVIAVIFVFFRNIACGILIMILASGFLSMLWEFTG